jgi:hypothetical protein
VGPFQTLQARAPDGSTARHASAHHGAMLLPTGTQCPRDFWAHALPLCARGRATRTRRRGGQLGRCGGERHGRGHGRGCCGGCCGADPLT